MAAFCMEYLRRKPYINSILFCVVLLFCFGCMYDYKYASEVSRRKIRNNPPMKSLTESGKVESFLKKRENTEHGPLVFIYNKYFEAAHWYSTWDKVEGSEDARALAKCPTKCVFTSNPNFLPSADFVLVSVAGYKHHGGQPVEISYSKGDQIWTGFMIEGPYYGINYADVDGIFDWVATYRRDSDIFTPYGRFQPVHRSQSKTSLEDVRATLSHKKLAAWLVSHCDTISQRDTLVKTLQRYIPVDVFGKCSKNKCPETKDLSCRDYMSQNYKFYLAFENSLCVDYVTEKFFLAYQYNMVPVTFGWVDYSVYGPPGSYINALDYDSIEDLANYLLYLDKNDDEYLKYFDWRGKYVVHFLKVEEHLCTTCKVMKDHMDKRRSNTTSGDLMQQATQRTRYPSFRKWQESLPSGQSTAAFHVGEHLVINSQKGCINPSEHPNFQRWIDGD